MLLSIEPFDNPQIRGGKAKTREVVMQKVDPEGTPKNQIILYLESRQNWRDVVSEALAPAGYTVLMSGNASEALEYHSAHANEITAVLCGETNGCSSNNDWAAELHAAGQKVLILACFGERDVPFLSKGEFMCEKLLPMLEQVIGGQ